MLQNAVDIENFVERILSLDMTDNILEFQRTKFGSCIKNQLPLDTSRGEVSLHTAARSDDQIMKLVCAVGASGIGKTHLA
jgi:hypothetical protein